MNNTNNKIIAIDYDGTITNDVPFPQIASVRPEAKKYIKLLYEAGFTLVLWTARKQPYFDECIETLKKEGLYQYFSYNYDAGVTGKIAADFYIDDKSLTTQIDWESIYNFLIKKKG